MWSHYASDSKLQCPQDQRLRPINPNLTQCMCAWLSGAVHCSWALCCEWCSLSRHDLWPFTMPPPLAWQRPPVLSVSCTVWLEESVWKVVDCVVLHPHRKWVVVGVWWDVIVCLLVWLSVWSVKISWGMGLLEEQHGVVVSVFWPQPLPFNHIRCRGVAAIAGSVYSMDRKLGWKGGHTHTGYVLTCIMIM